MLKHQIRWNWKTRRRIHRYLRNFFRDKVDARGQRLRKSCVVTSSNVELFQLGFCDSVDVFYIACEDNFYSGNAFLLFCALEAEAYRKNIPKWAFGGILLIYAKACLGFEF